MARRTKDIRSFESHRFFCINCGRENFAILRCGSQKHEKFHRKKLYCPWCKLTINNIECRNQDEVDEFKRNYENGVYEDERKESLAACRSTFF